MDDSERLARNAYMREWKKLNKDKVNAQNKRYKDKNREKVREKERGYAAKARAANPQKFRDSVKRYRERHPEETKLRQKDWITRNPDYHSDHTHERIMRNYVGFMLYNCKRRAAKKGLEFALVAEDIVIPEVCPVLGIPITVGNRGRGSFVNTSPSLDRIVPELGYIKENVRIISARANNLKNNGTPEELMAVALYAKAETERVRSLMGVPS